MATNKPEDAKTEDAKTPKQEAQAATQKVIDDSNEREAKRQERKRKAQEPDLAIGQQTGGTHDAVTTADLHVEPMKAEALYGTENVPAPKVVGSFDPKAQKVEYASKAELEVPAKTEDLGLEGVHLYVREMEDEAQLRGVVVVEVSYPGAAEGIYEGRDSGIRLRDGARGVKFSDGSTS